MLDLSKYQPQWVALSGINTQDKTFQFRKDITPESTAELAKSLAADGQKFPVVLWRKHSGELVPVSGLRRIAAAGGLKWEKLLAVVIPESEAGQEDVLRLNFIENVERKTLTNLDIMFACKKLNDQGKPQMEIGKLIGKSETQVRRYIRVAEASADAQAKLAAGDATIKGVANEQSAPGADLEQITQNTL